MTLKSIVTAIAQAVALAFLVAPNSLAQQGGESARGASQSGETARPSARKVGKKLALNSPDSPRIALNSLDPRCVPKPGAEGVAIARLQSVVGNVLVSTDTGLAAVEQGQAVQSGARVMTMTKSSVLVRYCDGCDVPLGANQRYEISLGESCRERLALREPTLLPSGDAATAALEASDAAAATLAASDAEVAALAASASTSMTAAILAGALPASSPLIGGIGLSGAIAAIRDRVGEAVSPN